MKRLLVVAIAIVLIAAGVAVAADEPVWLLFQRGLERMDGGEYGEALELFERIRSRGVLIPETEVAIGDIYRLEGEKELAAWHYDRAYEWKDRFEVPDDRFVALYRLVELYWVTEQYAKMEDTLLAILHEDPEHYQEDFGRNRELLRRTFQERDLDRVVQLFRFKNVLATRAHSRLAWFYARIDRPMDALDHGLFSIVSILTEAMEVYQQSAPSFRFDGVAEFMALAERKPEIQSYLADSTLASDLYSVGITLYALGRQQEAAAAWHILSRSALSGRYRNLADRQLASPRVEPLLEIRGQ